MPRATKNAPLVPTPVLPKIPKTKKTRSPGSSENRSSAPLQDIDVEMLSEEGKLLYTLLSRKFESFIDEIQLKNNRLEELEKENIDLRGSVTKLEERLDALESLGRGSNFVLSGATLPENASNLPQNVVELLRTAVQYQLPPQSIISAYRIGPRSATQSPDKRNVMIKLRDRETKRDIMSAFRTVKPKNLYANDDLTPQRARLLYLLRVAKRRCGGIITACGSIDGEVYVYLKPPNPTARSRRLLVNSMERLEDLCRRELNTNTAALTDESTLD